MAKMLNEICCITTNGNDFVGIKCENKTVTIKFPIGYFYSDEQINSLNENDLCKSIENLFAVLSDETILKNIHEKSQIINATIEQKNTTFPMVSYLNVIKNFITFGYIFEHKITYAKNATGKISWKRTIQYERANISEECDNLFYINTIAQKNLYTENSLITLVHKFCVHDATSKLGFIYGVNATQESELDFDYELFSATIQSKRANTFTDRNLQLLNDLQNIVDYLAHKHVYNETKNSDFFFGVNTFAPVWESLINSIFLNLNANESIENFNPQCNWIISNKVQPNVMRPDTIMRNNLNRAIFVLDAKYYSYGISKNSNDLPVSESINKQIVYAEFIDKNCQKFNVDKSQIYNAFLMPYCANSTANCKNYAMQKIGFATVNWKTNESYKNIYGIILDVKSVMQNYSTNKNAQKELYALINKII